MVEILERNENLNVSWKIDHGKADEVRNLVSLLFSDQDYISIECITDSMHDSHILFKIGIPMLTLFDDLLPTTEESFRYWFNIRWVKYENKKGYWEINLPDEQIIVSVDLNSCFKKLLKELRKINVEKIKRLKDLNSFAKSLEEKLGDTDYITKVIDTYEV